jgi:hypothetical protein
VILSGD